MKKLFLPVCSLVLALSNQLSTATVLAWDPNGTTSVGGNGTWDTTTKNWSSAGSQLQTNSSSLVAWNTADAALFCAGPSASTNQGSFTITVNSAVGFAGIFNGALNPGPCTVTISGTGSLSLASGLQGFDTYNSSIGNTKINVPITGSGIVCPENSGQLFLNATNTYTGGTTLGFSGGSFGGLVNFNNASSFGTGTITISNCLGGALVAEGSSAISIANPWVVANTSGQSLNIVGNAAGITFSGNWNLGANTIRLGSGGGASDVVIISGVIGGTGGLIAWNTGILELNNAMTYSGPTTVSNTCTLTLGTSGSITGAGLVTVMTNASLAVTNTTAHTIAGAVTFQAAASPNPAGTAIFNASGSSVGSISVGGNLTLNSTPIIVHVTGTALAAGSYTLMSCSGSVSGSAASSPTITGTALPAGYVAVVTTTTGAHGSVVLNVVKPPTVSITPSFACIGSNNSQTITAVATGTELTYQWQFNGGSLIGGQTVGGGGSTLTINPVTDVDAGTYTVTVSNPANSATASQYLVVIDPASYSPGAFTMNFSGPVGQGFRIWATTNLPTPVFSTNWTLMDAGEMFVSGGNQFTDFSATSTNGEYYVITVP